jgi:fucose permease
MTPTTRPRLALILIAFVAFVSLGLPDGVLGVAWPSVRGTFGLPVSHLGSLLTAGTCGYLVSSFSSGAVVPRLGVGRLLLISSLLMVGASAGFATAPAWPVMVAMAVVGGIGSGAIDAGLNAYAAHHFSPRLVNWLHAFYGVGATLGPLLMTAVLAVGLSWRWGYATNAAVLGIMAACFLVTLRLWEDPLATGASEPSPRPAGRPDGTGDGDGGPEARASSGGPAARPAVLRTLRRPVVWMSVLLFFLYTGLEVATGQWVYTLFTEGRGIDPAVAGVWVGVYWASLTAGRIVFGSVAGRVPPLLMLRATMLAAPLGALLIWSNQGPLGSFLGLALMGFCFAPMFPLLISLTPARVGRTSAAQAIGFQVSAASLGAAGVPALTGVLARWRGLEVIGLVLLCVAAALLVLHETIARLAARTVEASQASRAGGPEPTRMATAVSQREG